MYEDYSRSGNPAHDSVRSGSDAAAGAIETGTTIVALTAEDSVVVAADRRASVGGGRLVTNKTARKIDPVHPTAVVGIAGSVGGMQEFVRTLRAEASLYATRRGTPPSMDAISTLSGNLLRGGPYVSTPVLAGVDDDGPRVFDLDFAGGVMESPYVSAGSGMQLAFGLLEREYDAGMAAEDARSLGARAVESASARDTASGDGLVLAEVTRDGVAIDEYDAPAEAA